MKNKEEKYIDDLIDGLYGIEGSFTQPAIFSAINGAGAVISAFDKKLECTYEIAGGVVTVWNVADIFKDVSDIIEAIYNYRSGTIPRGTTKGLVYSALMDASSRGLSFAGNLGGVGTYLSMVLSVGSVCLKRGTQIITDHINEIERYLALLDSSTNRNQTNYNNVEQSLVECGATLEQAQQFVKCYQTIVEAMDAAVSAYEISYDNVKTISDAVSFDGPGFSDGYMSRHNLAISAINGTRETTLTHYLWSVVGD